MSQRKDGPRSIAIVENEITIGLIKSYLVFSILHSNFETKRTEQRHTKGYHRRWAIILRGSPPKENHQNDNRNLWHN